MLLSHGQLIEAGLQVTTDRDRSHQCQPHQEVVAPNRVVKKREFVLEVNEYSVW